MWQKGRRRRRRQGGGGPAKLRAGHTAAILFAYPDALLDAFPACGSSPPSRGRHPARRLLIRLRHRLTAEAAARRCPIWARRQHGGGVRFGHVRPAIRAVDARQGKAIGGLQHGEGGWGGLLGEIRGGGGRRVRLESGSAMGNRKRGWR